ncbi:dinG family ATP-dependent helicase YoaA [Klebsiella pneumoniae]|nr:dinG family ATP-dependent helicase YoaA [Klebsiella pneumoniae]
MIDDFAADGQLAKAIPGFKPREPQRQMAVAVSEAIEASRPLVVEAGTGTGKTYAYLAPALRAKKKVIISTGSKALQDQLYSRDLPTVAKALKFTGKLALLKGRSNYLCLERLEQQALAGGDLPVQTLSDVILLRSWSNQTRMAISAPAPASRKTLRPGRWSPAPTITVSVATAHCIKIASW